MNISSTGAVTIPGAVTTGPLSASGPSTLSGTLSGTAISTGNFIVNSAVGIGTAGPSSELHVVGTGQFTGQLVVAGLTTATGGLNFQSNNTNTFRSKAANTGSIGYQLTTSGAMHVYGAGTAVGS